jgi:hypothetical protein
LPWEKERNNSFGIRWFSGAREKTSPNQLIHAFPHQNKGQADQILRFALGCAYAQSGLPFEPDATMRDAARGAGEKETAGNASNHGKNASYLIRHGAKHAKDFRRTFNDNSCFPQWLR